MKGDWDINKEKKWQVQLPDETFGEEVSAEELGITGSLLWDKVKDEKCPKFK